MEKAKGKIDTGQGFRNELGGERITSEVNVKQKSVAMFSFKANLYKVSCVVKSVATRT